MLKFLKNFLPALFLSVLACLLIFAFTLVPTGEREIAQPTNLDGIPFAKTEEGVVVSESLAHASLYLNQPGLFKELKLTADFIPPAEHKLLVGVRENSFWLSYSPVEVKPNEPVYIDLNDKLQDRDQSYDIMFFAMPSDIPSIEIWLENRPQDKTEWILKSLKAETKNKMPRSGGDWLNFLNFFFSAGIRERAI